MSKAAAETRKYKVILSAVHMVYRLVNSTYNVKELSLRLTRLLCQFIRASSASIYILDPAKKNVILVASFNNKINILLDQKYELRNIPEKEWNVTRGASIYEKRTIGLPLISDDNIGAIIIHRKPGEQRFNDFDREMLSVFAEQAVTAIKNLQLYEDQQKTMLSSINFIGRLLQKQETVGISHAPAYLKIVKAVAEKLNVGAEGIKRLEYASILHDTGLVDVPYQILRKRGGLTSAEFKIIRDHPARSVALIRSVGFLHPVLPIILYHHEKYDGTGYPSGLKKEQIPIGARIMSVVDAFEAMVADRPYRKAMTIALALDELRRNSGTQFDPKVVKVFTGLSAQKNFRNYLSLLKA